MYWHLKCLRGNDKRLFSQDIILHGEWLYMNCCQIKFKQKMLKVEEMNLCQRRKDILLLFVNAFTVRLDLIFDTFIIHFFAIKS